MSRSQGLSRSWYWTVPQLLFKRDLYALEIRTGTYAVLIKVGPELCRIAPMDTASTASASPGRASADGHRSQSSRTACRSDVGQRMARACHHRSRPRRAPRYGDSSSTTRRAAARRWRACCRASSVGRCSGRRASRHCASDLAPIPDATFLCPWTAGATFRAPVNRSVVHFDGESLQEHGLYGRLGRYDRCYREGTIPASCTAVGRSE